MNADNLGQSIREVIVEEEIKTYYLDYAMSVNIGRSIPDAKDGLKPVHRRILFAMNDLGNTPDKPHKKSARIVGDVLGKYHPHGESSVYDAVVRLAQEFSTRYPLVDGQGNFGSIDGDSAAAQRYTEVRLTPLAMTMLDEIDQNTIAWTKNFDNTLDEPVVLPAKLPIIMLNGASGIGVGMASNIPPHNLGEVVDCLTYMLDRTDEEVETDALLALMPGPDFPTGGQIISPAGIRKYYETGRGSIITRGISELETEGKKIAIIIKELPYMVNKAQMIADIADLVRDKKIEGISDLRDESDREGLRVVIELKQGADPAFVETQLFKHTTYQTTFGVIMLTIIDGKPVETSVKQMLRTFLDFRIITVRKRTEFELKKAQDRKHILEGLRTAISNIDETIQIIRAADSTEAAANGLKARFGLSDEQTKAILDMRLARLTKLEADKIEKEIAELVKRITDLTAILEMPEVLHKVIRDEFLEMKRRFADKRRTKILSSEVNDIRREDLISDDSVIISMTKDGYMKRVKAEAWRAQGRGGKGVIGMQYHSEDSAQDIYAVTNKTDLLAFTNLGKVFKFKVYDIPETGRAAKGTPITSILPLLPTEFITTFLPVTLWDERNLMMVTAKGTVKKLELRSFENVRKTGIIAITLEGDDWLKKSRPVNPSEEVIIVSKMGQAIRFNEGDIRITGRSSKGVIGIRLDVGDQVIGMEVEEPETALLCISENGYGKCTDFDTFRLIKRGGKGVRAMNINEKSGTVVGCRVVRADEHLFIITVKGQTIRMTTSQIPQLGRYATGVRLIKLEEGDKVISITRMDDPGSPPVLDENIVEAEPMIN